MHKDGDACLLEIRLSKAGGLLSKGFAYLVVKNESFIVKTGTIRPKEMLSCFLSCCTHILGLLFCEIGISNYPIRHGQSASV